MVSLSEGVATTVAAPAGPLKVGRTRRSSATWSSPTLRGTDSYALLGVDPTSAT